MLVFERLTLQNFSPDSKNEYIYWVEGMSSNPPLVLLYGYTGVHQDLLEIVTAFKDKYFIIIPELPGWNNCPPLLAPLTIQNYAKHIKSLVDHLGLKKIRLFGHCMGTITAIEFTSLYPQSVEQLFLVSPLYVNGTWQHNLSILLVKIAKRFPPSMKPLFFIWRSRILTVPLDFVVIKVDSWRKKLGRIKDHLLLQSSQNERAVEENWISYIEFDFNKIKSLTLPVHIIHGEEDLYVPLKHARKFATFFSSATLDIIPSAGHVPSVETPQALVRVMRSYYSP